MKERPILFSRIMVRAILERRKTTTRRIVKPQPGNNNRIPNKGETVINIADPRVIELCPYGQPCDRLWVRETFCMAGENGTYDAAPTDGRPCFPDSLPTIHRCFYRATEPGIEFEHGEGWKPSIHMPRWASRIDLAITGLRVERLNEISPEDVISEGIGHSDTPIVSFAALWNSINAKPKLVKAIGGDYDHYESYPWSNECFDSLYPGARKCGVWKGKELRVIANPWVWVIEFKRVAA